MAFIPQWIRTQTSPADYVFFYDAAVTTDGNVIACGVNSTGDADVGMVIKYAPDGTIIWSNSDAGAGYYGGAQFYAVSPTSDGGAVLSAEAQAGSDGTLTFGGITISPGVYQTGVAVAKISSTGVWEWMQFILDASTSLGVDVGPDDSVVVTGWYSLHAITIGSTTLSFSTIPTYDPQLFVAKLSSTGTWLWAEKAMATGTDSTHRGGAKGWSVVSDHAGGAWVTGTIGYWSSYGITNLTAHFGSLTVSTGAGHRRRAFLAHIDSSGTWTSVQVLSVEATDVYSEVLSIATADGNTVYVGGRRYNGYATIWKIVGGTEAWRTSITGSSGDPLNHWSSTNAVAVAPDGSVWAAGALDGSDDGVFGDAGVVHQAASGNAVWAARLSVDGVWTDVIEGQSIASYNSIFAYGIAVGHRPPAIGAAGSDDVYVAGECYYAGATIDWGDGAATAVTVGDPDAYLVQISQPIDALVGATAGAPNMQVGFGRVTL